MSREPAQESTVSCFSSTVSSRDLVSYRNRGSPAFTVVPVTANTSATTSVGCRVICCRAESEMVP